MNSSRIICLTLLLGTVAAPSARSVTIQYDFTGVFYQSDFQNIVKVGDTFTASLQIDYSAPLISVGTGNGGFTYALFNQGIPSFTMTFNGLTLATAWPSPIDVYWNTVDRLMLWNRSFGFHHNVWVEGGSLFDLVFFNYPNAGAPIPANFGVYGDLVPIAAPSSFSFSLGAYIPDKGTTLNAYGMVTSATMKDVSSNASVPDLMPSGMMFAGVLASLLAIKNKGWSRRRRNVVES